MGTIFSNQSQKTLCCFILKHWFPENQSTWRQGWEPETNWRNPRIYDTGSGNIVGRRVVSPRRHPFSHKHFDSGLRWVPFLNANILVRIYLYVFLFHRARIRFHWHAYLHGISISVVKSPPTNENRCNFSLKSSLLKFFLVYQSGSFSSVVLT